MRDVLKFLWQSIKQYRIYYLVMLIAPICGAVYEPIVYYAIKLMVDTIANVKGFTYSQILFPFFLYLIADVVLSSIWSISEVALWKSQPYVQRGIILNALNKILSFRYQFFQNTSAGSITSKIKGILDGYNELWAQLYFGITFWLLTCITTCVGIFLVNIQLGVIVIAFSVFYVLINYCFALKINDLSQAQNEAKHKIIGEVGDAVANVMSIKLFSSRKYEANRLQKIISGDYIPKEVRLVKFHFKVDIINDILGITVFCLMILLMVKLRKTNLITVGDFVFVFGMVFQFQKALWHLMQEFNKLSDRMGDLTSSLAILTADESEYIESSKHVENDGGMQIQFKDVCFKYEGHKQVFNNLNFTIKAGEKVGVVGYTGCGKTTLINLLLKILIPESGQILLNGIDINELDSDYLRSLITIIPQDITLFHRSLMENIDYTNININEEHVRLVSANVYADKFIQQMPQKYATIVGERGVKLSGGQRQRIAIARAILKDAPILILDEATSALDSITEKHIGQSIKQLVENKTVIAIAHRLSTLKGMDRLIVFDHGRLVEMGTHDELILQPGSLYAKIWQTQYDIK